MGWSKTTRILVMLAIDIAFFLLELITGFIVDSLALTADAFHMLNDIISLMVGLWAVYVARKATSDRYSYGWLRAEILGAFFNAVFLIALCVSIVLEALTRFLKPPEITNPKLIIVVGALGLASNLVGFLVLGSHGHAHGNEEHDHDDAAGQHGDEHVHGHDEGSHGNRGSHKHLPDKLNAAEQGLLDADSHNTAVPSVNGASSQEALLAPQSPESTRRIRFCRRGEVRSESLVGSRGGESPGSRSRHRRRANSLRHSRLTSIDDIGIYPPQARQALIAASRPPAEDTEEEAASDGSSGSQGSSDETPVSPGTCPKENTPLIKANLNGEFDGTGSRSYGTSTLPRRRTRRDSSLHIHHNHNKLRGPQKGHGHSHADMGMNAMVLHVIGDALGNVGVIATGLFIWLTDFPGRFYADPAVSLLIALIILKSALPLTGATSKILLQATPEHIDLNLIREDIQALPGVVSCHHVHVWQLSDTKLVASMHIQVAFPISEEGGEKYMILAKRARRCLHGYGIHSATIQPEFCLDDDHDHGEDVALGLDGSTAMSVGGSVTGSHKDLCLLECVDDCVGKGCCSGAGSPPQSSHSAHSIDGGNDHRH